MVPDDLEALSDLISGCDGGTVMAAYQAVQTFQGLADHVTVFNDVRHSKSKGIRRLLSATHSTHHGPADHITHGPADHIADAIFAAAPSTVVLRTMLDAKHLLPLATISQTPDNALGNFDALLGTRKRYVHKVWAAPVISS